MTNCISELLLPNAHSSSMTLILRFFFVHIQIYVILASISQESSNKTINYIPIIMGSKIRCPTTVSSEMFEGPLLWSLCLVEFDPADWAGLFDCRGVDLAKFPNRLWWSRFGHKLHIFFILISVKMVGVKREKEKVTKSFFKAFLKSHIVEEILCSVFIWGLL